MARQKIEFFFDVISPYSWCAFEALCRYRGVWPQVEMVFRPFLLGAVMQASGNQPPIMQAANVPTRMSMIHRDLHRAAHYWAVPLHELKDPFDALLNKGSMSAQRYLVSLQQRRPEKFETAARALWMRRWGRDQDIHTVEALKEVSSAIGLSKPDAETIIANIEHQDTKNTLKVTTKEAVDKYKAFGAPWIVVHTSPDKWEAFFGSDRFPYICETLGVDFPGPMRNSATAKLCAKL